ncbi:MAG: PspC domain-containing protein, partial [Ignavibacteria bacterium]|nr:PspC domain-containing protein [Ignavibacteria bacterium]
MTNQTKQKNNTARISKSNNNKILFGVCGGIAEYLKINSAVIRFIFLLSALIGGIGLVAYAALIFILPKSFDYSIPSIEKQNQIADEKKLFYGLALTTIGVIWLLDNLDIILPEIFVVLFERNFIPLLLIVIGIFLIFKNYKQNEVNMDNSNQPKKLTLSDNKMIFGVCAGIGEYLNVDPTVIRIVWV